MTNSSLTTKVVFSRWTILFFNIIFVVIVFLTVSQVFHTQQLRQRAATNATWVTRSGGTLFLQGKPFRFSGTNEYWLGQLGSGNNLNRFPTQYEIDDGIDTARQMGATVIRSFGTTSVGCADCIEPVLGQFNPGAFTALDYALVSAKQHNIHLILTLLSDHDGKPFYNAAFGIPTTGAGANAFFTDQRVITAFKNRISFILNHVNALTGIAYKDDPTIMAWETGNEMQTNWQSSIKKELWLPEDDAWTKTIAEYIKSIDPVHLVADGHSGLIGAQTHPDTTALALSAVDLYSDHAYPKESQYFLPDAANTAAMNKVFFIGEYDWTGFADTSPGPTPLPIDTLGSFVSTIEDPRNNITGDLFWDLFPHSYFTTDPKQIYGFVPHQDHFTLNYTTTVNEPLSWHQYALQIRQHAYTMQGVSVPASDIPPAPLLNPVKGTAISWRGVAGADAYSLQRSENNGSTWQTLATGIVDGSLPYIDTSAKKGSVYVYRVQAVNIDGVAGPYSGMDVTGTQTPTPPFTPSPTIPSTPTPTTPSPPTPTPPANSTNFLVTLCPHGLGNCGDNVSPSAGGNTNPLHPTRNIMISLTDSNNSLFPGSPFQGQVTYGTASQNFQGTVAIPNLPSGHYFVSVKMEGYLSKQMPGIITVTQQQVTLPSVSLVTGDIDNNNQVNLFDYNALIDCYGIKVTNPSCLFPPTASYAGADILDDGPGMSDTNPSDPPVDGGDYNEFLRELSVQQGN